MPLPPLRRVFAAPCLRQWGPLLDRLLRLRIRFIACRCRCIRLSAAIAAATALLLRRATSRRSLMAAATGNSYAGREKPIGHAVSATSLLPRPGAATHTNITLEGLSPGRAGIRRRRLLRRCRPRRRHCYAAISHFFTTFSRCR